MRVNVEFCPALPPGELHRWRDRQRVPDVREAVMATSQAAANGTDVAADALTDVVHAAVGEAHAPRVARVARGGSRRPVAERRSRGGRGFGKYGSSWLSDRGRRR